MILDSTRDSSRVSMCDVCCKNMLGVLSLGVTIFSPIGKTPDHGVNVDLGVWINHIYEKMMKAMMSNGECDPC